MCDKVKKMSPVQTASLAPIGLLAPAPFFQGPTPPRAHPSHPASNSPPPGLRPGQPTLLLPVWAGVWPGVQAQSLLCQWKGRWQVSVWAEAGRRKGGEMALGSDPSLAGTCLHLGWGAVTGTEVT